MSNSSERVYRKLKSMILEGHFAPGAQLKEEELAELFGVSRTPVRDIMRRLEAEMFIQRSDSQRSFVRAWTEEDMEELFHLRTMMESEAAQRAAGLITDAQLATLAETCDAMEGLLAGPDFDVDDFSEQNRIFHETVTAAANSTWLSLTIERITLLPQVHHTVRTYSRENLHDTIAEHRHLVRALAARDPEWARSAMVCHVRRAFHTSSAKAPPKPPVAPDDAAV